MPIQGTFHCDVETSVKQEELVHDVLKHPATIITGFASVVTLIFWVHVYKQAICDPCLTQAKRRKKELIEDIWHEMSKTSPDGILVHRKEETIP